MKLINYGEVTDKGIFIKIDGKKKGAGYEDDFDNLRGNLMFLSGFML
ncbi:MAG: hypothetical protein JW734_09105 [Candidatus Omnitrophica bacterium]|nr:hypothetical protein [Candidatus Omnitrophota bacterium]